MQPPVTQHPLLPSHERHPRQRHPRFDSAAPDQEGSDTQDPVPRRSDASRPGLGRSGSKARFNQRLPPQDNLGLDRKSLLLKVFQGYTSFGERSNLKHLRSNKLHKMMGDCGVPLDKTTLDLLFVSENRHKYGALKAEAEHGLRHLPEPPY